VSQPESEANQQGIEFLRIEISLAITFMDVVETPELMRTSDKASAMHKKRICRRDISIRSCF
jgi:hypothetical protein